MQAADTLSFVETGRLQGVSASAVGKAIARLEQQLGVRLFHRSTRSVALTAEGQLFLARCRRALDELELAEAELTDPSSEPRGTLRVSLPLASSLLLPVLSDFMQAYPQVRLDLDFGWPRASWCRCWTSTRRCAARSICCGRRGGTCCRSCGRSWISWGSGCCRLG